VKAFQTVLIVLLLLLLSGSACGLAVAQQNNGVPETQQNPVQNNNPDANQNGTDAPPAPLAITARPLNTFPSSPDGFYRGNGRLGGGQAGFYMSFWKILLVFGLFALWVWSCRWVGDDSKSLKVKPEQWNSLILCTGLLGCILVILIPRYILGLAAGLVLYGLPLGLYIHERNQRVPDSSKVLTPQHIQSVIIRALAQVGIHIGPREVQETALGPPIQFLGKSGSSRGDDDVRSRQVEKSRGYMASKELIYDAILRRSTDVHLEPKEEEMSVRIRIDGVMYPTEPFDKPAGEAIVNIFKVLSAMDITERRRPQDGSFRALLEDREVDFRSATQGTRHGEKLTLRILDQSNSVSSLQQLGMRKTVLEKIKEVIHQPHGMFIACGPTGAGKSTTLYAALNDIDSYQSNIITVEDPIEYKMSNVNQIEINTRSGQTFANSLRSILRQDPDVVMIGEIRDGETAEIACQAANTGHMVFSTLHANDTFTALYRMLELGVEPYMVANSLSAVIGQRLARRLCDSCKVAYKPKPELLKKAGLPPSKIDKFYRPPKELDVPCNICGGLGYRGRIGIYEFLHIGEQMRDMIREKVPLSTLKAEARKEGMLYMKEEGLRLVIRGVTSMDEVLRVVK